MINYLVIISIELIIFINQQVVNEVTAHLLAQLRKAYHRFETWSEKRKQNTLEKVIARSAATPLQAKQSYHG